MKRKIIFSMCCVLVAVLMSCAGTPETAGTTEKAGTPETAGTPAKSEAKLRFGYVVNDLENQSHELFKQGIIAAAAEEGIELRVVQYKDGDIATYSGLVKEFVDQHYNIIVALYGGTNYDQALIDAMAAGIPVITIDSKSNIEGITCHVGIDNYAGAAAGAEWMGKALGGKGTVVTLNGMLVRPTGRDRRNGFVEYLNKNYPDIKIHEVATDFNMGRAHSGMEGALAELKNDIQGVYCAWDGGTINALDVLDKAGLVGKMKLVGFDGSADALSEMKAGRIDADVAWPLFNMGYTAVKQGLLVAQGKKVEPLFNLETKLITNANVDEWVKYAHLSEYMTK
ncbi:sugar ABC transporter substrate-binding protein [Treponema primitia]|uniref:sugar ABC transporter substrate-binding protein n=1 Tax=Treponema primitia TaxID=88058 RepID=UPI003980C6D4